MLHELINQTFDILYISLKFRIIANLSSHFKVSHDMTINSDGTPTPSIQEKIENLEVSVNSLLNLCVRLSEENIMHKNNNNQLMLERSELQNKNNKARVQVEAMVERLKNQDRSS